MEHRITDLDNNIDRRLTTLDDPDIGRITRVEKELGWAALVRK